MGKESKKKEDKPKKNDFKAFLKKRAPIYLALIAMLVVFVIPEYTKGTLEKSFPEFSDVRTTGNLYFNELCWSR